MGAETDLVMNRDGGDEDNIVLDGASSDDEDNSVVDRTEEVRR